MASNIKTFILKTHAPFVVMAVLVLTLHTGSTCRAQDADKPSKVEVGVQFSTIKLGPSPSNNPGVEFNALEQNHWEPAIGSRFSLNLTEYVALDNEVNFFPRRQDPGGRAIQAQFGVKAGQRFKRFGIFAKARPGLVSFGEVITEVGTETVGVPPLQFDVPRFETKRRTFFSMDVGAVAEFYISRRVFTRVDVGDTIVRYGQGMSLDFDENTPQRSSETRHNVQFSVGIGFRFWGGR
jgi:hypothetical protein